MRQIKFRAWDKKGEQMVNHIAELRFDNNTLSSIQSEYDLDIDDGQNSGHYERLCNEIILMQFTGLKDKNGKDIYEGDLCKVFIKTGALAEKRTGYMFGVVEYHKAQFSIFPKSYEGTITEVFGKDKIYGFLRDDFSTLDETEVIGNIYDK